MKVEDLSALWYNRLISTPAASSAGPRLSDTAVNTAQVANAAAGSAAISFLCRNRPHGVPLCQSWAERPIPNGYAVPRRRFHRYFQSFIFTKIIFAILCFHKPPSASKTFLDFTASPPFCLPSKFWTGRQKFRSVQIQYKICRIGVFMRLSGVGPDRSPAPLPPQTEEARKYCFRTALFLSG